MSARRDKVYKRRVAETVKGDHGRNWRKMAFSVIIHGPKEVAVPRFEGGE